MVEFTMSAFARYPDGSTGDAFAEVCGKSAIACFAAMAAEVARWMPPDRHPEGGEAPEAIELTLGWRGEAAALAALALPQGPRDRGELEARPERGEERPPAPPGQTCAAQRPLVPPAPGRGPSCVRRRLGLLELTHSTTTRFLGDSPGEVGALLEATEVPADCAPQ